MRKCRKKFLCDVEWGQITTWLKMGKQNRQICNEKEKMRNKKEGLRTRIWPQNQERVVRGRGESSSFFFLVFGFHFNEDKTRAEIEDATWVCGHERRNWGHPPIFSFYLKKKKKKKTGKCLTRWELGQHILGKRNGGGEPSSKGKINPPTTFLIQKRFFRRKKSR